MLNISAGSLTGFSILHLSARYWYELMKRPDATRSSYLTLDSAFQPLVSVIIPTYNRAGFIAEAVVSALGRRTESVEVVVVDDGSKDETRKIVNSLSGPIHYLYQENSGLASARNAGIRYATGRYLCFLDSDDLILRDKFAIQISYLEERPDLDAVYSKWTYTNSEGAVIAAEDGFDLTSDFLNSLSISNFAPIHAYLFRRTAIARIGGFSEALTGHGYEDWDLLLRLAASGSHFGFVKQVTVSYRMHGTNMCTSSIADMRDCGMNVIERLERSQIHKPLLAPINFETARAIVNLEASSQLYRHGLESEAQTYFRQAIDHYPEVVRHSLLFNYLIAYLSAPELGHAAYVINAHLPGSQLIEFFTWLWDAWIAPLPNDTIKFHDCLSALTSWEQSRPFLKEGNKMT